MAEAYPAAAETAADPAASARTDLLGGLGWLALGAAIVVGSWRMDRLQAQGVPPYAAPGLLPGLLGLAMLLFGTLLALRGWRHGGHAATGAGWQVPGRLALVLALCLTFGIVLVGHGLPFWAASALFVAAAILVLRRGEPGATGSGWGARPVAVAVLIGLAAGLGVTLVFQDIFLVHLP